MSKMTIFKKIKIAFIRSWRTRKSLARIKAEMKADTRLAVAGVKYIQANERNVCGNSQ